MSEIVELLRQLESFRAEAWVAQAIAALKHPEMKCTGPQCGAEGTKAADLLRIYRLRLDHVRRISLPTWGLERLIAVLERTPPSEGISVVPFYGPTHAVLAFFESNGHLIVCVTVASAGRAGSTDEESADFWSS